MRFAALVLISAVAVATAPAAQDRAEPFVPIGVWYGGGTARPATTPRNPAAEREAWRTDLQQIRALGFNTVTSWVDWAGAEPLRGQYRFDALDQMLALAQEAGLRVILQLYPDVAPEWIGRQYPDASFVTNQGIRTGSQAAPGFCLDHPEVRAALGSFIAAVSQRAARSEAFHALDLWTPPRIVNRLRIDPSPEFCFCPHTQRRFRDWLQHKYGTLEALNAAWYRTFASWDEVEAPRYATALTHADRIDWKTFVSVKLHDDLQFMMRASAARGPRPTTSHADAPEIMVNRSGGAGNADDWWMGSAVDYYGTSIYPRPAGPDAPWSPVVLASALDAVRSAAGDRGWWLGELQAGQAVTGARVSAPVTADDIRLWGWTALGRGARALSYFAWYPVSSGPDAHGYGLIDLDGRVTERARAAGALARIVARNPVLFAPMRPRRSSVAILFNPLSRVTDGSSGTTTGSMLGFYRAMFERNIQVDFVHADEIAAGRASKYRAVFAGDPLMLQRPVADALAAYVRAGGTLISEARPAWSDERGAANARVPGFGLDEVFGAREKSLHPAGRVELLMERKLDGPLAALAGAAIHGIGVAEHLEISGSNVSVVARFPGRDGAPGDPAIVMSAHGKGRAILIGSLVAAAFEQDPDQSRLSGDLLAALAEGAGVAPEVLISGARGLVEARYLESPAATILIAINHADTPQKVTLAFSPDTPEAIWLNLETGASVNFVAGPEGPTYTHAFQPRDVLALMIKKQYR